MIDQETLGAAIGYVNQHGGGGGYVLPTATADRLGGVKIGSGISVEEDGTISASGGGVAKYADLPDKPSINGNELSGNKTGAQLGLQNALTFDDTPTQNSNNPVKSGGVYASDEAIRQWTTAEAKSVSGNPITLTDGSARNAEGLAVTCNPKQNLHGYDHPWAGGAGKNKLPMTVAGIKAANTYGTWNGNIYTLNGVTFELMTDSASNVIGINVNGTASANTNLVLWSKGGALSMIGDFILNGCPAGGTTNTYCLVLYKDNFIYDTGTGANISVAASDSTTTNVFIHMNSGTTASNLMFYPMCRLSTVSNATFEPYSNECPISGYDECVVDDRGKNFFDKDNTESGYIDGSGNIVPSATWSHEFIKVNGNTQYTISGCFVNDTPKHCWFDKDMHFISAFSSHTNGTFTSPQNASYMGICAIVMTNPLHDLDTIQVEEGNTATPFVPYSHANVTLTFGETIYGGSVDFKTGKVTVTHASIASYNGETINEPWLSSMDEYVSGTTPTTGAQVVYPLTTPIELTLTPAELELLKGYNYISTNGTTIALDYLPDSLLAEAENYVDAKIPLIRKGIFQVTGAGNTPVSDTIIFSSPFPTNTDIVLLSVRRDASDTSPENGVARVKMFSKKQFVYTFTGNNSSIYYVDYIAFGH